MSTRFTNKTVIVTGGNSGIGLATAIAFANEGAKVIITGRRKETIDEVTATNPNIIGVVADVRKPADAERVVDAAIQAGGGVDVLVNNAGIAVFAPLGGTSHEDVQGQFDTNVVGLFEFTKAALPSLTERKGSIVNISSVVGVKATPGASAYAATKAALNSLTRSWALELAPVGIRVNAVSPGPVETPIFGKSGLSEEQIAGFKADITTRVPLGVIGQPDDIALWVLNVSDPAAAWFTGQIIGVDGGFSA